MTSTDTRQAPRHARPIDPKRRRAGWRMLIVAAILAGMRLALDGATAPVDGHDLFIVLLAGAGVLTMGPEL